MKKTELKETRKTILKQAKFIREQIERQACFLQQAVNDNGPDGMPDVKHIQTVISRIERRAFDLYQLDGQMAMLEDIQWVSEEAAK